MIPSTQKLTKYDQHGKIDMINMEKEMSIREANSLCSLSGGQGMAQCNCKGTCLVARCSCLAKSNKCNSRCHSNSTTCKNI